ncbi:hypothetical protein QJS64_09360 [Paraclostridium bifermentans]|uniref:Uncharacterized protein n=1 Tax=Paraclostridium bifermentans TaxID=1490 RepID=A0ABY8R8K2_PARBF|nr:hypothetical protein QJS64_09360 [Paraclostridium bifermentans]
MKKLLSVCFMLILSVITLIGYLNQKERIKLFKLHRYNIVFL